MTQLRGMLETKGALEATTLVVSPKSTEWARKEGRGCCYKAQKAGPRHPCHPGCTHWRPDIWENDPSLATRKEGMAKEILKEVLRESKPLGCWSYGPVPPILSQAALLLWGGTSCCVILAPAPAHSPGVI